MLRAITREVSAAIDRCELTHLSRMPIDLTLARRQHDAYERCLAAAGCAVHRLTASDTMPDSVFVEDTAVVFDELALIARPRAESRRAETEAIAAALGRYRTLRFIEAPGTVDGGDVLVVGRRVFVGRSSRTNELGIDQMRSILGTFGYAVHGVDVSGCLHLKSAVTAAGHDLLIINPEWTAAEAFGSLTLIEVDPSEPFAANTLRLGDVVVYPEAFPRTRRRLEARGLRVHTVDVSETAKAEGGVTCCSLIFEA